MPSITSTGYKLCQAVISNGTTTDNEWENPSYLLLTDGLLSESNGGQASDVIVGNFPFALPQEAVITGFEVKFIAKRGGSTTPPITITPYAVKQTDSDSELFYPGDAVVITSTDLDEYVLGNQNYIFNTTWDADSANNFKVQLVSNGNVFVDSVLVNVFYYIPSSDSGESETSESCEDCNSPIQAQPFYLALPMTSTDLSFYLTSFNYPDGTEIQLSDLGECGGYLDFTFDEGKPKVQGSNFEENIRVTSDDTLERLANNTVKFTLASLTQRGLQFKTPYTADADLRSEHNANSKVILSNNGPFMDRYLQKCQIDVLVSAPITVSDENVELEDPAHDIDFRGGGVTAVNDITNPGKKIITIPGAGGTTPPSIASTTQCTSGDERVSELTCEISTAGINRGLLVQVSIEDTRTVTGVTFNGDALIQAKTFSANGMRVYHWYLIAPDIGTHDIVVTLSGLSYIVMGAEALSGVNQSDMIGSDSDGSGTGTAVTDTLVTTQDYSLVFDAIATIDAPIIYSAGPGQGQNWQETAVDDAIQGASSYQPAGVTPDNVIMSWTLSKSTQWITASVEVLGIESIIPGAPEQIAARAYKSASPQSIPVSTATKVIFDAETFDTNSNFASSRFTSQVSGYYLVTTSLYYSSYESAVDYLGFIYKNGALFTSAFGNPALAGDDLQIKLSDIVFLNVGDYVEIFTIHAGAVAKSIANESQDTYISIGYISANEAAGSGVQSVVAGSGIDVDNTDPQNPIISADAGSLEVQEDGTPIESPVDTINFIGDVTVTNPGPGQVDVEILSAGGTDKLVGAGNTALKTYFNIQIPFALNNIDGDPFWLGAAADAVHEGYCGINLSDTAENIYLASAFLGFPGLGTINHPRRFSQAKITIVEFLAYTNTDAKESFMGFNQLGSGTRPVVAGNVLSLGFGTNSSGAWFARSATGAAHTDTGISTPSSDTTHQFRIEYDPAATEARFYVDGTLVATITTNLPTAIGTTMGLWFGTESGQSVIQFLCAPSVSLQI